MGWKINMLVQTKVEGDAQNIANLIGFYYDKRKYEPIGETTLEGCINPKDDDRLYIGEYKGHKIITEANLPMKFLAEEPNFTEKLFSIPTINDREIYAFSLNSTINLWGYNIIKNKKRLRCKYGTHDNGVMFDYGEPHEAEIELLNKSIIEKGNRVYNINGNRYNEDQIGEEFIFRFSAYLFGERLDQSDELMETKMTIFECVEKKGFDDVFERIRNLKK